MNTTSSKTAEITEKNSEKAILERAIHKAVENGWDIKKYLELSDGFNTDVDLYVRAALSGLMTYDYGMECSTDEPDRESVIQFIFNHDFAKALWGENLMGYYALYSDIGSNHIEDKGPLLMNGALQRTERWEYHLQQMVIDDDPIKYLGGNL